MIIVTGRFEVAPGDVDAFIASKHAGMTRSRAEDGCLTYVFSADPIEPGVVHLLERWSSAEALDTHIAALKAAGPQPATVQVLKAELLRYEVASFGPLVI